MEVGQVRRKSKLKTQVLGLSFSKNLSSICKDRKHRKVFGLTFLYIEIK